MDVKVVESYVQLEENACRFSNGGCSHLCLRKPRGFSCQCPTGLKMRDGRNCEDLPSNFLLIALRSGIGRISLDTAEMFDVVLPIDGVHGAVVVDFHHNKSWLFFADVNADAIKVHAYFFKNETILNISFSACQHEKLQRGEDYSLNGSKHPEWNRRGLDCG